MKKCLIHICNNIYKTFAKVTGEKEPKMAIPSVNLRIAAFTLIVQKN